MPSALIALCVTTLVVVALAEPPLNIGLGDLSIPDGGYPSSSSGSGEQYGPPSSADLSGYKDGPAPPAHGYSDVPPAHFGGGGHGGDILAAPSQSKGVRYAGPIVYTNEKPPVIHFPPPPKPKKGGKGGYGKAKGSKAHSIKYVPLPHHDLPILIYQSDINPPIHVVHPPAGSSGYPQELPPAPAPAPQASYGVPASSYGLPPSSSQTFSSSIPSDSYGTPKVINSVSTSISHSPTASSSSYLSQASSVSAPAQLNTEYGAPAVSSSSLNTEYGAPASSSLTSEYGIPAPFGASVSSSSLNTEYGAPSSSSSSVESFTSTKTEYGPPAAEYGPPKAQKAQPLPHIIYTGHPPIHIFQQPPIYMSAPPKASSSYGVPPHSKSHSSKGHKSKGHSKGHKGHFSGGSHYGSLGSSFGSFGQSFGFGKASSAYGPPPSSKGEYKGSSSSHSSSSPIISFSFGNPGKGHHGKAKGESGSGWSSSSSSSGSKGGHGGGGGGGTSYFGKSFSFSFPKFKSLHNHLSSLHGSSSSSSSGSGWGVPQKAKSVSTGWGSSQKSSKSYVVAPKAWNKPPIIIYQGVRPPVHVYEKPAGGYADAGGYSDAGSSIVSGGYSDGGAALTSGYSTSSSSSYVTSSGPLTQEYSAPLATQSTHSVSPIALAQPVVAPLVLDNGGHSELAHVAGTNQPSANPAAAGVDLTYGLQRISPEAGQFIDPRYKNPYTAQSRSILVQQAPATQQFYYTQTQGNSRQPAALYVSDLTSAGQQYQILRRSDILDQSLLYGIQEQLRTNQQQQQQLQQQQQQLEAAALSQLAAQVSPTAPETITTSTTQLQEQQQQQQQEANPQTVQLSEEPPTIQARSIDILPNFLAQATNEQTLSSIPVSYSSMVVPSVPSTLESRSGEPAAAVESVVTSSSSSSSSKSASSVSSATSETVKETPTAQESESKSSP